MILLYYFFNKLCQKSTIFIDLHYNTVKKKKTQTNKQKKKQKKKNNNNARQCCDKQTIFVIL